MPAFTNWGDVSNVTCTLPQNIKKEKDTTLPYIKGTYKSAHLFMMTKRWGLAGGSGSLCESFLSSGRRGGRWGWEEKGQSQQKDQGGEVWFCLITAVWEALCTWRSPARQTLWHRRSPSAKRWSSSGLPEPCAWEKKQETHRQQVRGWENTRIAEKGSRLKHNDESGATFSICSWNHNEKNCPMTKQSHVFPPLGENFPKPDHKWRIRGSSHGSMKEKHMPSLVIVCFSLGHIKKGKSRVFKRHLLEPRWCLN